MRDSAYVVGVLLGCVGSIKLVLDLWKSHFSHTPPLHRQFADREEMRIELEKLHIAIAALRKENDEKRANLHRRIDAVAEAVSRMSGKLEIHLKENPA